MCVHALSTAFHTRERPFIYNHVQEVCSTPSLTKIFERPAFLILNTPVLYVMNPFLMTYRDILKCEIALCQRPVHTVLNHLMMSLVWKDVWKSILESNLISACSVKSHFQKLPIWRSILRFILEKIFIDVTQANKYLFQI